jgi:hypothetical protein
VTLLATVAATLESAGIAFALIGAAALAAHRVARATGDAIERAGPRPLQGARVPIVRASDLVLLKLYAAGPQDLWDVQRLLAVAPNREALLAEVESGVTDLGETARAAWRRLLEG